MPPPSHRRYAFPPFSVGEVGRNGMPGRREVGHGNLAERALRPAVPSEADFPYAPTPPLPFQVVVHSL